MILAAAQVYYARKGTQLASMATTEAQRPDKLAHMAESGEPVVVSRHSISARSIGFRAVWGPLLFGWAIGMSISRHYYFHYPNFNLLVFLVSVAVMIPLTLSPWGRQFIALFGVTVIFSAGLYLVLGPLAPVVGTIASLAIWEARRANSSVNDISGAVGMVVAAIFSFLHFVQHDPQLKCSYSVLVQLSL